MAGPLEGVFVLDVSRVLAGPWATQTLADLGATVVKIEHPKYGDDTRSWGPPYTDGEAAYYLSANRGKRSLALDIASTEGQAILHKLAAKADIFIENFKVDGLKKYGLDYASLSALYPQLIYCSITGYGQTGPFAHRAGYDFVVQAMSGLMSVTGEKGGEPVKVGIALADLSTGLYSTIAILSALYERSRTGRGRYIDMALLDVMLGLLANQNMNYLIGGTSPQAMGNAHPNIVPYQAFEAEDGMMVICAGNDGQFHALCRVAGQPALADDPRFATNKARVASRDILVPILEATFKQGARDMWVERLSAAGVPAGPLHNVEGAFADPQVIARQMLHHLPHTKLGEVPMVSSPIRIDGAQQMATLAPPLHGEHSLEILREIGLSDSEIEALARTGTVHLGGMAEA